MHTPVDKLADYEDELRQVRASQNKQIQSQASASTLHPSFMSTQMKDKAMLEPTSPTTRPQPLSSSPTRTRFIPKLTQFLPSSAASLKSLTQRPPAASQPLSLSTDTEMLTEEKPSTTNELEDFAPRDLDVIHQAKADTANAKPRSSANITPDVELLTLLSREQSLRAAAEQRVSQTNEELEELSTQLFAEANEMVANERKARARLEERVEILEKRDRDKRSRLELLEQRLDRVERVRDLLSSSPVQNLKIGGCALAVNEQSSPTSRIGRFPISIRGV